MKSLKGLTFITVIAFALASIMPLTVFSAAEGFQLKWDVEKDDWRAKPKHKFSASININPTTLTTAWEKLKGGDDDDDGCNSCDTPPAKPKSETPKTPPTPDPAPSCDTSDPEPEPDPEPSTKKVKKTTKNKFKKNKFKAEDNSNNNVGNNGDVENDN